MVQFLEAGIFRLVNAVALCQLILLVGEMVLTNMSADGGGGMERCEWLGFYY